MSILLIKGNLKQKNCRIVTMNQKERMHVSILKMNGLKCSLHKIKLSFSEV